MSLRGHSRSYILAAIESPWRFYLTINSNFRSVFNRLWDITGFFTLEANFSIPHSYSGYNLGVFPLE